MKKGERIMARCPYLEYESRGALFSQGDYYCDLCKKNLSESEVNYKCKTDYGDDYEDCSIYKNRQVFQKAKLKKL